MLCFIFDSTPTKRRRWNDDHARPREPLKNYCYCHSLLPLMAFGDSRFLVASKQERKTNTTCHEEVTSFARPCCSCLWSRGMDTKKWPAATEYNTRRPYISFISAPKSFVCWRPAPGSFSALIMRPGNEPRAVAHKPKTERRVLPVNLAKLLVRRAREDKPEVPLPPERARTRGRARRARPPFDSTAAKSSRLSE